MALKILLEGWFDIIHSYALVNIAQAVTLKDVQLYKRPIPYFNPKWADTKPDMKAIFGSVIADKLDAIPVYSGEPVDMVFRIAYPLKVHPHREDKNVPVFVFFTVEDRSNPPNFLPDIESKHRYKSGLLHFVTPSKHCAGTFIHPSKVIVIPHGVFTDIYRPLPNYKKDPNKFVFMNIGAMTGNKGVLMLSKVIQRIRQKHPHVFLMLKGLDDLYMSKHMIHHHEGIMYYGNTLSLEQLAEVYNCANVYCSPYTMEGFNMTVYEAVSCGTPLLVSNRNPTNELLPSNDPGIIKLDPLDEEQWFKTMLKIVEDQGLPSPTYKPLSWADVTAKLLAKMKTESIKVKKIY